MAAKTTKLWLARNKYPVGGVYYFASGRPARDVLPDGRVYWRGFDENASPIYLFSLYVTEAHKLLPPDCRLRPGQGPIEITVTISRSDKHG